MAGLAPPGLGAPGAQPGAPPTPPMAPPMGPMPGPMPGAAPPPNPFTAGIYNDLPSELPAGWQLVDAACRQLKLALKHPSFAKTPKVAAVLYSLVETMTQLLSHYTARGDAGSAPTGTASADEGMGGDDSGDAHFTSADADVQPPPESES